MTVTAALLFLFGLFFGSFFNVVIDRVPRGETFVKGKSHCDFCGHTLIWMDLVPLISFLFLRGKCRYCQHFLGWKYPVIEITTGLLFAITTFFSPSLFMQLVLLGIVSCLIVIFYTDLFSGIIPDGVLLVLFFLSIGNVLLERGSLLEHLIIGITSGLLFLFIFLITKQKGIGFGDVKLAFVMGMLLGFPFIVTGLYIAFLTGAIVALILVIARKKRFHQSLAFGPFLVLGILMHLFWGQQLWSIFIHILGI